MATTLPLIAIRKSDRRKDGAISFLQARVLVDGVEVGADFRARVGDDPIVIDGDMVTVSDAQAAAVRQTAAEQAGRAAVTGAIIARFGTLAPIAASSEAQLAYAEKSRAAKLPLFAVEIEARAAKWGWDAAKTARAFTHLAAQTDARFWIDVPTELAAGNGRDLYLNLWYHFASIASSYR